MNAIIQRVCANQKRLFENVAEDVFDGPIQSLWLDAYLAQPCHIMYVAIAEGTIVGQVRAIIHKHPDAPAELYVDNLGVLFGAHVCVFLRILTCMLITSTFCFGAKSKIIENPNASLEQNSRPTMPFRLMAVLHCLRTSELSVKLLRIR